jgi:hypothetical protein
VFRFIKLIIKFAILNCFNNLLQPKIYFILLLNQAFVLTPQLIIRFISIKLKTNFPLFQVLKFILRCLFKGVTQKYLSGFKLMFSGRPARRGRSRFI